MMRVSSLDRLALWIGRGVLLFVAWLIFVQTIVRLVRRYVHFPVPPVVAAYLDSPLRKSLQPPEEIVGRAGIRPGMTVLELGSGPGTFTVEAARRTLPNGKVIAVDIAREMIRRLQDKVRRLDVDNVEIRQADAYHLPAPDHSVDVAFMVTVLAEIPDRQRALAEIRRVLKPGGILSVSEFLLDPDCPRRRTIIRWGEDAGFRLKGSFGGRIEYTVNFRRP